MKSLDKVLEVLKKGQENQVDIVVNTKSVRFKKGLLTYGDHVLSLSSDTVQKELCSRINLPYSYYSILRDNEHHEAALNYNVKYWLTYTKKVVLIRCLKQKITLDESLLLVRGILSNKYHIINHYDASMELINQINRKVSKDISLSRFIPESDNQRFILEIDINGLKTDVSDYTGLKEDYAIMGVILTNSELGRAIFELQPYIKFANGSMILLDFKMSRVHLGTDLSCGVYDGGVDAVDFTLATINDLTSELMTSLNKETLIDIVSELFKIFKENNPIKATDAIEAYLKGVGATEGEAVNSLTEYLNADDKSAFSAYNITVNAILTTGATVDYYEKLDKARDLAITFGIKKGRKI